MREPDKNRVRRAMGHIMAAITNINSIKWEHRTNDELLTLEGRDYYIPTMSTRN